MQPPSTVYTQACEDRDFAEWHRGCPWCAVWLLRVEQPEVVAMVAQARAHLAPCLLPRYARQPHITLAYRGLMAAEGAWPHAEFGAQQLQADVRALQAAQLQPFALRLQGVGSFSTVPYLAVASPAPAGLGAAHEALAAHAPYPGWRYVPHLTLGHYGAAWPLATVLAQLQKGVPPAWHCEVEVSALWLARYRTDDIAGRLHFEGRFDLRTQSYQAEPGALMA